MLDIRYFVSLSMVKTYVFSEGGVFNFEVDGVFFLLVRIEGFSSWWESNNGSHIEENGSYNSKREVETIISSIPKV